MLIRDKLSQEEKDKYGYEYELMVHLEELVRRCDEKIKDNKARVEKSIELSDEDKQKIEKIDAEVLLSRYLVHPPPPPPPSSLFFIREP